jgi:hypothetical protein
MVLVRRKRTYKSRRSKKKSRRNSKKMKGGQPLKVAIFFVGRITAYQHCMPKLLEIKDTYNPVIFCSLNADSNSPEDIKSFLADFAIPEKQSNVEKVVYPEWLDRCYSSDNGLLNRTAMYSMFYNQNKAFNLIEQYQKDNSMQFDCILYYRADMISTDKLVLNMPESNAIYIPSDRGYGGCNDRVAYGSYESMKVYCNIINSLESMYCKAPKNPENTIQEYLKNTGLRIIPFTYNTDLHNLRSDKPPSNIFK